MNFENRYHKMSQNVTKYAQDLQFLNHAYKRLKINDKSFECVNVTENYKSTYRGE